METYGWFAHYVGDDDATPFGANFHTHGVPHSFGHKDLQIVFPLPQRVTHTLLTNAVEQIKKGVVFHHGDEVEGIVRNYKVRFVEAVENSRAVLRMIIPDKDGNLHESNMTGEFGRQYEDKLNLTVPPEMN